jgi:leader peptidase (prepilin peptidase) / N-methyltransferase
MTDRRAAPAPGDCIVGNPQPQIDRALPGPALQALILPGFVALAAASISFAIAPNALGLCGAGLALVVVAIAVIDGSRFVIPDWLVTAGLALAALHATALEPDAKLHAIANAAARGVALACVLLGVRMVYARVRGRQGLGLGDVKLAMVAGAWLDWLMMAVAIEIAAIVALSVYILRQGILRRPFSATHRLPFGLFFAPAIWICWALQSA